MDELVQQGRDDGVARGAQSARIVPLRRREDGQRVERIAHVADAFARLRGSVLRFIAMLDERRDAIEQTVLRALAEAGSESTALARVQGKRIVYVGGRPVAHAAIRRLVESAGGSLTVHDGGIEDRKGKLAASIPGADLVVFPVDCIDHDSMNTLKRLCERHRIAYRPLRTASVASFVDLMTDDHDDTAQSFRRSRVSAFCLRHG
ncbi:DUF2325 domain-containing protein [Burkholderia ubonensis]|uniref:DUF2325 domain-containing protein n=1 Tax=Burkholderia ubonensis TaxID=101571 RepID=UPI0007C6EEE3